MSDSTRRAFLATAGAGTVVGAAALVAPGAAEASESHALPAGAQGSMAAYIKDVKTGEVLVMVDDHEVTVIDKVLTARLAQAFARASRA